MGRCDQPSSYIPVPPAGLVVWAGEVTCLSRGGSCRTSLGWSRVFPSPPALVLWSGSLRPLCRRASGHDVVPVSVRWAFACVGINHIEVIGHFWSFVSFRICVCRLSSWRIDARLNTIGLMPRWPILATGGRGLSLGTPTKAFILVSGGLPLPNPPTARGAVWGVAAERGGVPDGRRLPGDQVLLQLPWRLRNR